jgi:hypothetical protein
MERANATLHETSPVSSTRDPAPGLICEGIFILHHRQCYRDQDSCEELVSLGCRPGLVKNTLLISQRKKNKTKIGSITLGTSMQREDPRYISTSPFIL